MGNESSSSSKKSKSFGAIDSKSARLRAKTRARADARSWGAMSTKEIDDIRETLGHNGSSNRIDVPNERHNIHFAVDERMTLKDFSTICKSGAGAFAAIRVYKSSDDKVYCMTKAVKSNLKTNPDQRYIACDRAVLHDIESPYCVSLHYCFGNSKAFHMVFDCFDGECVVDVLQRCGPFKEEHSVFYAAELCLALQAVHAKDIVIGDLSPRNLLLSNEGMYILHISLPFEHDVTVKVQFPSTPSVQVI